ncbi:DUF3313 family protein [Phenylobacterium sp.]|jgi:hypothetical protein|uniref:DUF3313 family protein n=1 Tax=Phenylobacterium sp. TaxID=1871053 RepID=UPI002E325A95|nr:DUF3313 family protein [Phenylobacterium sp.]HEX2561954.1 DUF3313 family protein [Phenylobacterium sp.]
MRRVLWLCLPLLLAACSTPGRQSGLLSTYDGLAPAKGGLRASSSERRDPAISQVRRIAIAPTRLAPAAVNSWLNPDERTLVLRELDAQLCFELSKRYEIAAAEKAEAEVRAVVGEVRPTGRAGSAASAAASFFIPGPIGLRVPGTLGGLSAEAEMVGKDGRQLAALVWNRNATALGTDDPSLSRVGDALQFAEAFGDAAGKALSPAARKPRAVPRPDPCAAFGPRLRVEGYAAKFITNLYVPQMSGARPAADGAPEPEPEQGGRDQ